MTVYILITHRKISGGYSTEVAAVFDSKEKAEQMWENIKKLDVREAYTSYSIQENIVL